MKKTFVINLILLLFLNLLVKPIWIFGIDRVVQIKVGETDYGLYYALFNFSFLFNIVLDAGITNFNNRHIAQNKQLLSKHFSWIFSTKLVLAILYTIITLISAWFLGYEKYIWIFLVPLIVNQFLASFILYLRSNISGLLLFKQDSLLSVLDRLLMILMVGYLLYVYQGGTTFKITWFIYAQTIAYALTALVAFTLVLAKTKKFQIVFKPVISIAILKQSLPFALLILLMTLYSRTDAIMIERLLGDGAYHAGVYAQGYRLLDALNNIAYLFAGLLLPIFSSLARKREDATSIINTAQNVLVPGAILVAILCWHYSSFLSTVLYPNATRQTFDVFAWLMLGFVAMAFNYVHGTLLTANNCLKSLNRMAGIALILNVSLNFLLIPELHAKGAAVATVITQFFTMLIHGWLVVKGKFYQFKMSFILKISAYVFLLNIGYWVVSKLQLSESLQMTCLVLLATVLVWIFRFIAFNNIKSLLKGRFA